ncbi:hypothetical protein M0Q50_08055 [bacterium]|jgi:hypothetical protein|nr:hypothetical protein [bacterium]
MEKLVHPFLYRSHDLDGLLKDTKKLSTFCSKLETQSMLFPDRYKPNDYKGDGFELFVEALIKLSPIDNRIGICNYQPVDHNEDTGVDGIGIGVDGKVATVQVKYRSNKETLLTANKGNLSNFVTASLIKYNVDPASKVSMLIITTAEGLHYFTEAEMFLNKVRCIGYQDLRNFVDNNLNFWNAFRSLVKESK